MTIATFESAEGSLDAQASTCFQRLGEFLNGVGRPLSETRALIIEVTDWRSLDPIAAARRRAFGEQKPAIISRRLAWLPHGELVRLTVLTEPGNRIEQP